MTARPFSTFSAGIATFALLGTSFVYGQRTTPGPTPNPPTTTPTPGTGPRPGTIPGTNLPQTPNQLPSTGPDTARPIFLSGKVLLSDGTPPPDLVLIERVCGTRIIPEGMTDRKGRFSFQLGQNSAQFMDASTSDIGSRMPGMGPNTSRMGSMQGNVTAQSLMNCELRASLAGFRSETVSLAMHRAMDNPDIGTIVLRRMGNVEGLTISATSVNAPKDARKDYDKGHEALLKGKYEDARKHLEKAVAAYPKYAAAWFDLGAIRDHEKDVEGARKAFQESIAADGKYVNPYEGLAQMAARERKWQEVADITDRIIQLNRFDFPRALFLNAVAKLNLNKLDEAEKSATELIAMDTRHQIPRAEQVLGVILAQKQNYPEAAVHIRRFIELAPDSPDAETAKKQLSQLEKSLAANGQQQ